MPIGGGFYSEEQAENFAAARGATQFGGPARAICGARNRRGSVCARTPIIEGRGRCLLHCGPKAAGEFRERQHRAFLSGRLSYADWTRQEARRAANRLKERWKKHPWHSGGTIDLGADEATFRETLREMGSDMDAIAPVVADWLRWRFRRTQIDRCDDRAWTRAVREELPGRVAKAGPCPVAVVADATLVPAKRRDGVPPRTWTPDLVCVQFRRTRPDLPRAPKVIRGKGYRTRGRPRVSPPNDAERAELAEVFRAMRTVLAPLMGNCGTELEQTDLLRTARNYARAPDDPAALRRWIAAATALRPT